MKPSKKNIELLSLSARDKRVLKVVTKHDTRYYSGLVMFCKIYDYSYSTLSKKKMPFTVDDKTFSRVLASTLI